MKKFTLFFFISFSQIFSQTFVFEHNDNYDVDFKTHTLDESKKYKIDDYSNVDKSSPEGLAQSYFFASNDDWNKINYLEKDDISPKKPSHYEKIKELDPKKIALNYSIN